MEGEKGDRPKWIVNTFRQVVEDIVVYNVKPLANLKKAITEIEKGKADPQFLNSFRLSKDPQEYQNANDRKRK